MSKTGYPLATRLAVAGALVEFFAFAVWMLCEQYVGRRALDWGLRDHMLITSTLITGAVFGMFVTPVLLIKGLFTLTRNDSRPADALRPLIWHSGLASAGLALPGIYVGQFHAGGFWTILLTLPAYVIAFCVWLNPSPQSA